MSSGSSSPQPPPPPQPAVLQRGLSNSSAASPSPRPKRHPSLRRLVSTESKRSGGRPPSLQRGVSTISSKSSATKSAAAASVAAATEKPSLLRRVLSFFSHLSLILMIGVYTALGGYVFVKLELPNETRVNEDVRHESTALKRFFLDRVWKYTEDHVVGRNCTLTDRVRSRQAVHDLLLDEIRKYEDFVYRAADANVDIRQEPDFGWNYARAMFFSATVITTIGYGNIAPVTTRGRIFCIVYAIFGIPLTLIAVADMGKLFARFVVFVYKKFKRMMEERMAAKMAARKAKELEKASKKYGAGMSAAAPPPPPPTTTAATAEEVSAKVSRTLQSLKVVGAMTLLLLYIYFGAVLFIIWEKWDLFESFYFCFITMTTIGLGDIVPAHPNFMLLCTVYILIGLALTSTCIELARSEYEKSWQRMVEASKRLQGLSGVNLADTLKKLGDHIELHGDIVDLDLLKDLKNAVKGVHDSDDDDDDNEAGRNRPPPIIIYETTV